eukprot:TRINITY_DN1174_c0_g1_i1.p3 TRINITY_DN1174_c0_g1~~TRINITY_DN1174_c0_g1_i1.p3  ORF type:complete len:112 (+),score=8.16 TRINITY_DN1174_c0_g1_i1:678-1013(+)
MAGGAAVTAGVGKERAAQYKGRVTCYVIVASVIAALGGSLFGYDIGISGISLSDSAIPLVLQRKIESFSEIPEQKSTCRWSDFHGRVSGEVLSGGLQNEALAVEREQLLQV